MKKIIPLLTILFYALTITAAVPGYEGRRFYAGLTYQFGSPNVLGNHPVTLKSKPDGSWSYGFGIHQYAKVSADYILSEKCSGNIDFKYSRMGYAHRNYSSPERTYYNTRIEIRSIDLGWKTHLLGNIAPLGVFLNVGASLHMVTESDPLGNSKVDTIPFKKTNGVFAGLFLTGGHNIKLNNHLILTTQYDINMALTDFFAGTMANDLALRWQESAWFNLGIGLYYLL